MKRFEWNYGKKCTFSWYSNFVGRVCTHTHTHIYLWNIFDECHSQFYVGETVEIIEPGDLCSDGQKEANKGKNPANQQQQAGRPWHSLAPPLQTHRENNDGILEPFPGYWFPGYEAVQETIFPSVTKLFVREVNVIICLNLPIWPLYWFISSEKVHATSVYLAANSLDSMYWMSFL